MYLFRLYLSPTDEVRFKVIVTDSPAGEKEVDSKLPFFDDRIDRRITVLKALEAVNFRQQDFPDEGEQAWMVRTGLLTEDRHTFLPDIREHVGKELYKALFPEGSEVKELLQKSIALAQVGGELPQLHVQFKIEADVARQGRARLADYPWELMCDERGFLARRQVVFSRYLAFNDVPPNLSSVGQINVLLISSTAFDPAYNLPQFSSRDQQAIRDGLENAVPESIHVLELKPATFGRLRAHLTEQRDETAPHVLHFDGHGYFGKRCEKCCMNYSNITTIRCGKCGELLPSVPQGFLLFENEEGGPDYVSAQKLGDLLQNANVTLVVLSACRSGFSQGSESVFNGIAQGLIRGLVPAVVAMQYKVSVSAAAAFAEQFYRSLGQRFPLVRAVSWGREAIGLEGNQWYRPVLYLRWQANEGGQLFVPSYMDLDSTWLRDRMQYSKKDFVTHMAAQEDLTTEQATKRYVELLVQERGTPQSSTPPPLYPLSQLTNKPRPRVLLLGEGGGGKTTGLLKLAFDTTQRAQIDPKASIPLYVKLNAFDAKERGFDRLLQMASNAAGLSIEEMRMRWQKSSRPFLFLLDGFNEVGPDFQSTCIVALQELLLGRRHQYLITSRPAGQVELLAVSDVQVLEVMPLDEDQIEDFLTHRGLAKLYERMGELLRGLAGNPFMLWALAQSYATLPGDELPANMGQLYKHFIDDYIFKMREPQKHHPLLRYDYEQVKQPILAQLAYQMTQQEKTRVILQEQLQDELIEWLENIERASRRRKRVMPENWTVDDFLNEVVYNGVVRRESNTLEFMHQSVQDYFTALMMVNWPFEKVIALTPALIWRHIKVDDYGPIGDTHGPFFTATIMLSGLLPDSSDLLRALGPRHPLLAAYCLVGSAKVEPSVRNSLRDSWLAMLNRHHDRYRRVACRCLTTARLKDEEVAHRLVEIVIHDENYVVKWEAIHGLATLNSDIAARQLVEISLQELDDKTPRYSSEKKWRRAAFALYSIKSPFSVRLLFDAWRMKENGEAYCSRAELLLGYLWHNLVIEQLKRILQEALNDENTSIKEAAEDALQSLSSWQQRAKKNMGMITADMARDIADEVRVRVKLMPRQSVLALINFLKDDKIGIRLYAVKELGKRVDEGAVVPLLEALWRETDVECACSILMGLKKCSSGEKTLRLLRVGQQNTDDTKRRRATLALGVLGDQNSIPSVIHMLREDDHFLRAIAAMVLGELGAKDAIVSLNELLLGNDEKHEEVLEEVIRALGKMKIELAITSLGKALVHSEKFTKYRANKPSWRDLIHGVLEQLDAHTLIIHLLREALQDQNSGVRTAAVEELRRWGNTEMQIIALLQSALQDLDSEVRVAAVRGLGSQQIAGIQVIDLLREKALRDSDGKVRAQAVIEIGRQREAGPQIVDLLQQAQQDPDSGVRLAAVRGLGNQRAEGTQVVGLLHERVLHDPDSGVRVEAVDQLSTLPQQTVEPLLTEVALSHSDGKVRERAAGALKQFDGDTAIAQLLLVLQGTNRSRRIAAIEALGVIEDDTTVAPLMRILNDSQGEIRIAAANALIKMKDDAAFDLAMQTLRELSQDANGYDREKAAKALMDIPDGLNILCEPLDEAYKNGNYAEMLERCEELLSFFPGDRLFYWYRSDAYLQLGQFEQALADIDQAIKSDSFGAPMAVMHVNRANILSRLQRNEEALDAARRATELSPDDAHIQGNLGWYAYKANQYKEGITASQRALELDPEFSIAAFNLGLTFLAAGQIDKAKDAYQRAIKTCQGVDKESVCVNMKGALADLDELGQCRLDLVSIIEEIRQVLKEAQPRSQTSDSVQADTNDHQEIPQSRDSEANL